MAKRIIRNNLSTDQLILEAALEVLEDEGHGGFSIPKVAQKAGIYQGNVTYYYPNRDSLIVALADKITEKYSNQFENLTKQIDLKSSNWAEDLIVWLIDDAIDPKTARVFPELWSLANAHPEIAKVMENLYEGFIRDMIKALGHDPKSPKVAELWRVLRMLEVAVEGMTAVYGRSKSSNKKFQQTRQSIVETMAPLFRSAHKAAVKK
jgi:AcrR family transcriptional regulator